MKQLKKFGKFYKRNHTNKEMGWRKNKDFDSDRVVEPL